LTTIRRPRTANLAICNFSLAAEQTVGRLTAVSVDAHGRNNKHVTPGDLARTIERAHPGTTTLDPTPTPARPPVWTGDVDAAPHLARSYFDARYYRNV
jgi:hypothetical protein